MTIEVAFPSTTFLGTRWPLPTSWKQSAAGAFSGPEGILNLSSFDGELLDPSRCASAAQRIPGEWVLARTANGVAIHGHYVEEGAAVVVCSTRSDAPATEHWRLPEVQASYVFRHSAIGLAHQIRQALDVRPFQQLELGIMDDFGHSAMGPVPIHVSWFQGHELHAMPRDLRTKAVLSLIGGGVMTLADETQCCALLLEPLPWRDFSLETAMSNIGKSLGDSAVRFDREAAGVWNWQIAPTGCSYEAFKHSTNSRVVGAAWADQFGQSWHLRYRFGSDHGKTVEQELLTAK